MTFSRIEGFDKILSVDPHKFARHILNEKSTTTPQEKVTSIKEIMREVLMELEKLRQSPDKVSPKEIETAQKFVKQLQTIEDDLEMDIRVNSPGPLQKGINLLKERIEEVAKSTLPSFPSAPPPSSTPKLSQPHPPSTPKPSSPAPESQPKPKPPSTPKPKAEESVISKPGAKGGFATRLERGFATGAEGGFATGGEGGFATRVEGSGASRPSSFIPETPAKPTPPSTKPPLSSKAQEIAARFAKKPATFEEIQAKIKALDLNSPTLKAKIEGDELGKGGIKDDLKKLAAAGGISDEQRDAISGALELLHQSGSFSASPYERVLLKRLAKKNPALKKVKEKFPVCEKQAASEARSRLLTALKEPSSPELLVAAIKKTKSELDAALPEMRFQLLEVNKSPPFDQHFSKNFHALIKQLEKFTLYDSKIIHSEWNKLLGQYELINPGFKTLLKNHQIWDPLSEKNLEALILRDQISYIDLLNIETINKTDPASINAHLKSVKDAYLQKYSIAKDFQSMYARSFHPAHLWITEHFERIKKSYDQGSDIHTNLGEGVCLQNCFDRYALIFKKPTIPSQDIPMGSSQSGRVAMIKTGKEFDRLDISLEKALSIESASSARVGLQLGKTIPISAPSKISAALDEIYKESGDNTQILFSIYAPGSGHAINIQLDSKNGMFRFMDDNFGVCEFRNYEECKKALIEYLKAFYPKSYEYKMEIYTQTT